MKQTSVQTLCEYEQKIRNEDCKHEVSILSDHALGFVFFNVSLHFFLFH